MILPIFVYGAEILREKAKEIDVTRKELKDELKVLVSNMWETMTKADGVGLAAPQVGRPIRLLIVDGSLLSEDYPHLVDFKRAMINPVLIEESKEEVEFNEGCLSIPDIHCGVIRPKTIRVSYYDTDFVKKEETLDDFACRMVQHEMDHLDGILFTDRAAPIRRKMIQGKLNNIKSGRTKTFYKTVR
ncbi:MAG: peptide deformylase [Bacteroidales bacterium]|jgi:peptide deformylase